MTRTLAFLHRWIGVALCAFFAMWFASGIVMIYVPFPSLPAVERLERSEPVDLSRVREPLVALLDAAGLGDIDRVRMIALRNRPLLIVEGTNGSVATLHADDGARAAPLVEAEARSIAERFADTPALAVAGPVDFDQWVVHQQFDRARPFFRVDLDDARGTQLYVSQVTGEVVQRTARAERFWNYLGAVPHWIYPTVIRKNWLLWDRLVWWLSLAGIASALLGITLGIVRLRSERRRGRRGLASPFIGWMRWHHVTGLAVGVFVTTWIVSGWLSMDHGRLFPEPDPTAQQIRAFRGLSVREAVASVPVTSLLAVGGAHELAFSAVAGRPIVSTHRGSRRTLLVGDESGGFRARQLSDSEIESAISAAWPGAPIVGTDAVPADDAYAHLREGTLGANVRRTVLGDAAATWVHVDPESGEVVSVMNRSRRVYRWLFNGLHSLDLPGFVDRRPLWDMTMILLLASGFGFSVTAVVLGYRRLSARLRVRRRAV